MKTKVWWFFKIIFHCLEKLVDSTLLSLKMVLTSFIFWWGINPMFSYLNFYGNFQSYKVLRFYIIIKFIDWNLPVFWKRLLISIIPKYQTDIANCVCFLTVFSCANKHKYGNFCESIKNDFSESQITHDFQSMYRTVLFALLEMTVHKRFLKVTNVTHMRIVYWFLFFNFWLVR